MLTDTTLKNLAGFLRERPAVQIKASIVPKIVDELWSKNVFDAWSDDDDITKPVKNCRCRTASA